MPAPNVSSLIGCRVCFSPYSGRADGKDCLLKRNDKKDLDLLLVELVKDIRQLTIVRGAVMLQFSHLNECMQ